MNDEIVNKLACSFAHNDKFVIIIKPHPVAFEDIDHYKQYPNVIVTEAHYPISRLLCTAYLLFTHLSGVIVEAILFRNKVVVIKDNDDIKWPPWHEFYVYKEIELQDIDNVCTEIEKDGLIQSDFFTDENRKSFLQYFRYTSNGENTKKIIEAIPLECREYFYA